MPINSITVQVHSIPFAFQYVSKPPKDISFSCITCFFITAKSANYLNEANACVQKCLCKIIPTILPCAFVYLAGHVYSMY